MFTPVEEQIRLAIGGHAHELWDGWSVESDLLTPADAFQLELFTRDTTALPAPGASLSDETKITAWDYAFSWPNFVGLNIW